tara:strand:- start:11053 stop:11424 length:372 start_codon:yes stop_codon:yes gene_type:complete
MLYGEYSFSEEPFSNGGISYREEVTGSEAVTFTNNVAIAASAVVDVTGVEAQTFINNDGITIIINSVVVPTGVEAETFVANVNIWSFETGDANAEYALLNPNPDASYANSNPSPSNTWDDLVI